MKHHQASQGLINSLPKIKYPYQKILRLIQRHPEKLYMNKFQARNNCGTTCCIAGWTIALGGQEAMRKYWAVQGPIDPMGSSDEMLEVVNYASLLLRRAAGDVKIPGFFSTLEVAKLELRRAAHEERELYGVLDYYWSPEVMFFNMQNGYFSDHHDMLFCNPKARQ